MSRIIAFIFVLSALLVSVNANGQGIQERHVKALENLETEQNFGYEGIWIPVPDITYHEFSSDSVTWRKNYVDGDCYVRFANTTSNTTNPYTGKEGYHDSWWVLNICDALDTAVGNGIDTVFFYYYQNDTIYSIDTVVMTDNNLSVTFPAPDTLTGSTTNFMDSTSHSHVIWLYAGDLQDVDDSGIADGQILKWNAVSGKYEPAEDLTGGGSSNLTVREVDGSPSVSPVTTIQVENGHVTNLGAGAVNIDFSLTAEEGEQDFYRTDTVSVSAGDNFITFSSPLPLNDYIVANAYALYSNGERQPLSYDSLAVDGFRVLGVAEASLVHYLVIRDLDSLGVILDSYGKISSSVTDILGYLNSKTDDSTITVVNNDLHVIPHFDSVYISPNYTKTGTEQVGNLYWNTLEGFYEIKVNDEVTASLDGGMFYAKASEAISNGQPVMYAGAQGSHPLIQPIVGHIAELILQPHRFLGIATQDFDINEFGYVAANSQVNGVYTATPDNNDSQSWTEGDILFVDFTTGYLTNVMPQAGNPVITAAIVQQEQTGAAQNGIIFTRPTVVPRFTDLSDVNGTPAEKNGQIAVYSADSSWFDLNYNILDTTASLYLDSTYSESLIVGGFINTDTEVITTTIDTLDETNHIVLVDDDTASGAVTIVLPSVSGITGREYIVGKLGTTGSVTVDGYSSETINGNTTHVLSTQFGFVKVVAYSAGWFIISQ